MDARMPTPTVIAFGEALVDRFRDRDIPGGAPFNVACHLAAFGVHPVLLTRIGKDAPGARLLGAVHARGLDTRGLQRDPVRPTGTVEVGETRDGHVFDILPDQAYDHIHAGLARMIGLSVHPAMIYFGTLAQRGDSRRALRALLDAVDAHAFLDVNLRDPWVDVEALRESLRRADTVKLNEDELIRIAGHFVPDAATVQACASLLITGFALRRVVVTRGAAGAWTLDADGRIESAPGAPAPRLVDTVGAGDAFAAVFMLGRLYGWPVAQRLARADAFARAVCGLRGAVPDTPDFYRPFAREWKLAEVCSHA